MVEGQAGQEGLCGAGAQRTGSGSEWGPPLGRQETEQGCCRPPGEGSPVLWFGASSFVSSSELPSSCRWGWAGGPHPLCSSASPVGGPRGCAPLAWGLVEACQPGAVFLGGGATAGPHDHHSQTVGQGAVSWPSPGGTLPGAARLSPGRAAVATPSPAPGTATADAPPRITASPPQAGTFLGLRRAGGRGVASSGPGGQDREKGTAAHASRSRPPAQLVLVKLWMFGLGRSERLTARAGSLLGTVSQTVGVGPEPRPGLGSGAGWRAPRPPLEAARCGVCNWPQRGAGQGGIWVQLPTPHRGRPQSSLSFTSGAVGGGAGGGDGERTIASTAAARWAPETRQGP